MAWVPTNMSILPEAKPISTDSRALPFSRPVRMAIRTPSCSVELARWHGADGEDFGRRQECSLRAGFDRGQHRQYCDQSLARTNITLEQPQHRRGLRHVTANFFTDAGLSRGRRIRELSAVVRRPSP